MSTTDIEETNSLLFSEQKCLQCYQHEILEEINAGGYAVALMKLFKISTGSRIQSFKYVVHILFCVFWTALTDSEMC